METVCRIAMQPPLFEIKLKKISTSPPRSLYIHAQVSQVSSLCPYVITVSQIAIYYISSNITLL